MTQTVQSHIQIYAIFFVFISTYQFLLCHFYNCTNTLQFYRYTKKVILMNPVKHCPQKQFGVARKIRFLLSLNFMTV